MNKPKRYVSSIDEVIHWLGDEWSYAELQHRLHGHESDQQRATILRETQEFAIEQRRLQNIQEAGK